MKKSSFWEWEGKLEPSPGSNINDVIPEAIRLAKSGPFSFVFNDVSVTVHADSDPALIYRDWSRALSGYITGAVGPYPSPRLSAAELARDVEVEAQNEARREASRQRYEAEARTKREAAEARLADAPGIALADAGAWDTFKDANTDGYGGAVVTFAERWARLMQLGIAEGKRLEDIADPLVSEADLEGITGFMYGCAVSVLVKCWTHGEALRRWHNLKTQVRDEGERANASGGVLNPALLSLGE
jgi:hypothetical protein